MDLEKTFTRTAIRVISWALTSEKVPLKLVRFWDIAVRWNTPKVAAARRFSVQPLVGAWVGHWASLGPLLFFLEMNQALVDCRTGKLWELFHAGNFTMST